MKQPFEGGCACGAIRYRCEGEPVRMFFCHCRDCQRATGGPFASVVMVPVRAFRFTQGTPVSYATPSARGGENTRSFCGFCGSRLTGGQRGHLWPFIGVAVSSLDDPGVFKPEMHFFVSQAQPWDRITDDLPQHPTYPPKPPRDPGETSTSG